ncbi:uncharacterized protein LOC127876091 [Dreissena polymorpha]|uniref:Death domain-containing protein n=1 Tax=Dreissena polymorpha TaxID=45954 RepID=A0A9D4QKL6_DREPO|nr:uncharacterized protein LOC127876091 [Dreissena polymorpha]KAH3834808.1 hypothetical protein DPMN_108142 [Dreissena polymorpha]
MKIVICKETKKMIHGHQANASWHFVLVFSIALSLCIVTAVDSKCSANENKYWDRKLKVCAKCTECAHGQARNLSEKYIGSAVRKGDTGCLPCQRPPPGYYIRVLRNDAFFQLCGKKCADLFRHQQIPCGDFSDAVCGSCYAGYREETNNADFACIKNTPPTTTTMQSTASALKTNLVNGTEQLSNDIMPTSDTGTGALVAKKDEGSSSATKLTVGISCGVVAVVGCLAIVLSVRWKKLKQSQLEVRQHPEECFEMIGGRQENATIPVGDSRSDMTTDSPPRRTNIEGYSLLTQSAAANEFQNVNFKEAREEHHMSIPQDRPNRVDMSLASNPSVLTMDGPRRPTTNNYCRPELSIVMTTVTEKHNAMPLDINRHLSRSIEWTICKCQERRECNCKHLSEQSKRIKMLDKMDSIDIVARHICHDPKYFFQSLKVVNSKFYQTFVDIDRREERAESYRNVLRKWVEIKGDTAFLSDLIDALCKNNFHDISNAIARDMNAETNLKHMA